MAHRPRFVESRAVSVMPPRTENRTSPSPRHAAGRPRGRSQSGASLCRARSAFRRCSRTGWRSDVSSRANAQGRRADRGNHYLPPGGATVHRQADRTGAEFRRAGGYRHREHPAAQRAAPAHRRSHRVAGAADRDVGGAESHLQLAGRIGAGVPAMLENATRICGAKFGNLYLYEGDAFRRVAQHNAPPGLADGQRPTPLCLECWTQQPSATSDTKQLVHIVDIGRPGEPPANLAGA